MHNPFLIGEKIYLRSPEDGDEQIIAISENHPTPRETLFYALPRSPVEMRDKIRSLETDPGAVVFTICLKQTDEVIGMTFLYKIDWISRSAVYYIAISEEKNWSQGYGKESTRLMVQYAFETINLNRIQLHVFCGNERAVNAYKKTGFKIEGTLRQAMYRAGTYHDFYVMGLLREDFIPNLK